MRATQLVWGANPCSALGFGCMNEVERCDAAKIVAVLAAAAQPGSRLLLDQPIDHLVSGPVRFTTASLWRVSLWCCRGELMQTLEATAPDGRTWRYGCQRMWCADGSAIDPVMMLTNRQRNELYERLMAAMSWPEPEWETRSTLPDFEAIAERRRRHELKKVA